MKPRYFLDVYCKMPSSVDAVKVICDREINATCYSKAYEKAVWILKQNKFDFDNIFIVINVLDF